MFEKKTYILTDKNAQIVFVSQLISTICDKMMSIGLVWYLTKNYSINVVPWFLCVSFVPHVFMSLFSSRIILKHGVLKTIIGSEFFRGSVLLLLFATSFFTEEGTTVFLLFLFVSTFLLGIGASVFNPAMLSLPPLMVESEKIPALNGLLDASFSFSNILGAISSILILNYFDIKYLIAINGLSFLFAGIFQTKIVIYKKNTEGVSFDNKINTWGVVKKYEMIKKMLLSFLLINIIFTPILVIIPWYVENIYKGDARDLAIIEGAMGAGAFLTGFFLSLFAFNIKENKRVLMMSAVCFFFGLSFLLFSFSSNTMEASIILFIIGSLSTFLNVQILTYFQTLLHENEIPSIMVAVNVISAASMPLSFAISGILFPLVNVSHFAFVSGGMILAGSFIMLKFLQTKENKEAYAS